MMLLEINSMSLLIHVSGPPPPLIRLPRFQFLCIVQYGIERLTPRPGVCLPS